MHSVLLNYDGTEGMQKGRTKWTKLTRVLQAYDICMYYVNMQLIKRRIILS